jgi:hypothetical protein
MAKKKKCGRGCKRRGPGRPAGSKNKRKRKSSHRGGAMGALAMNVARAVGPTIATMVAQDLVGKLLKKKGSGMYRMGVRR